MNHRKRYLVTGGSKGIGRSVVDALLRRGHRVLALARNEQGLEVLAREMADRGYAGLETLSLDMGDLDAVGKALANLPFLEQGLDGLVCNAAYQHLEHAMRIPLEEIEHTWRVNALSPILTMQRCYEALRRKQGTIVYMGSVSDSSYVEKYAAYGASKAYMNSFLKHAAFDTGPEGVRLTIISPGATDTPMLDRVLTTAGPGEREKAQSIIPLRRFARPEEVAEAVLFALEGPTFFHGDDLRIHGGTH